MKEFSQKLDRGILSKVECLEAARDLHFDVHTLDEALQFLHDISEVFYFFEILPNIVFTNPQVIVDKMTEFVEAIYSVRERRRVFSEAWQRLRSFFVRFSFTERISEALQAWSVYTNRAGQFVFVMESTLCQPSL